jgi:excisionase family DNA binding protein
VTDLQAIAERLDRIEGLLSAQVRRWLSVDEAAAYSGLSDKSIRRMISAGKLTAHRPVRGAIKIDRGELDAAIKASTGTLVKGRGMTRNRRE